MRKNPGRKERRAASGNKNGQPKKKGDLSRLSTHRARSKMSENTKKG